MADPCLPSNARWSVQRKRRGSQAVIALAALCAVGVTLTGAPNAVSAHPADRLAQHLLIQIAPTEVRISLAIGGGILANDVVLSELDRDGDQTVGEREIRTWLATLSDDLLITIDGQSVAIDADHVMVKIPPFVAFQTGQQPIVLTVAAPLPRPAQAAQHIIDVRNRYQLERTDHRLDLLVTGGITGVEQSWPGPHVRIAFIVEPASSLGPAEWLDAAAAWEQARSRAVGRAEAWLARPKTPRLVILSFAVFAVMGVLHAAQPGHGKTLVAAYLVATGGTAWDAVALASVVTFTHTFSVFALGLGTLAASRAIPLSRIVPGLSLLSSLTVTAIGAFMLWKAVWHECAKRRHDGQHAHVADQEHAAHHLREALAVRGERRVTLRSLVALGVTGGIVPCPDALAILLLAIGANQVVFGLLALVAFSLGLAGVLVAVGMAVAISGRALLRIRQTVADSRGYLPGMQSLAWQRLLALSPVVRAAVVLVLGFLMLWRASASL